MLNLELDRLTQQSNKRLSSGSAEYLGARITPDGVNFALFSHTAKEIYLLLFDAPDGPPTDVIKIENRSEDIWHVLVHDVDVGQLYAYKIKGDYNSKEGLRFNPHKLLIDPYAKALTGPYRHEDDLLYAYDVNAAEKDLVIDQRDNSACVPKSIVVDDTFDWQNDQKPSIAREDLIIYETHLKGLTAHPSSHVKNPGTYLGFIEKIPYLKELGINAVELMPIHEFYVQDYILKKGLTNYWGYDSIGFFAPSSFYRAGQDLGCQVHEFKTLVRELHKAGLEVILDVVYNHTAEGNELGPTLCFKGIDNQAYYHLQGTPEDPRRYYRNDTGCGNTFNVEHPAVMRLVLDSLRYWVEVMHVDGFRCDLATVLGHTQGQFNKDSVFFNAIAQDPVLKDVKFIAEPWDLTTYQVGNFPKGWMEWNGKFRDTTRKFIKGDDYQAADVGRRLIGSRDLYADQGRNTYESVNFLTCHDGFTLHDLFSYNDKHNEANLEDNKDGTDEHNSWNCGGEGETKDLHILKLRKKMVKNSLCALFFSFGTPMILCGDEVMRTQKGNNNVWCQDNNISWFDWNFAKTNAEILEFFKKAVLFRKKHPLLGYVKEDLDIQWFNRKLESPQWEQAKLKTLCFQIKPSPEAPQPSADSLLFFVLNAHHRGSVVRLPHHHRRKWFRVIDTSRGPGDDFHLPGKERMLRRQDKHYCPARSVIVLTGKRI